MEPITDLKEIGIRIGLSVVAKYNPSSSLGHCLRTMTMKGIHREFEGEVKMIEKIIEEIANPPIF